jgi:hypothetical protein
LLIGRQQIERSKHSSYSYSSQSSESEIESENKLHVAEKDDDSPYFVKIIIDQIFLASLEEPNLVEPQEIIDCPERCQVLMENKIFTDLVNNEVATMFYKNRRLLTGSHHTSFT